MVSNSTESDIFWSSHFTTYQVLSEEIKSATFIELKDCLCALKLFREKFPDEHFRVQRVERYDSASVTELLKLLEEPPCN